MYDVFGQMEVRNTSLMHSRKTLDNTSHSFLHFKLVFGYGPDNCTFSGERVAPPSDGHQECLSSRRIRRGVHGLTTRFKSSTHPRTMCQLKKPLYDVKQAPRAWHSKITQYLHRIDFRMSKSDNSLYMSNDSRSLIFIILYVDDLVIGGEHLVDINKVMDDT